MMTISKKDKLNELLEEIRECHDCKPTPEHTPVVYSAEDPDIFIVSEIPPSPAWTDDLGDAWRTSTGWIDNVAGTSKELIEWLELTADEAAKRLFWIQRANCHHPKGRERNQAFEHCSMEYIQRAISAVEPVLIITLGQSAAKWFFQFHHLDEIVGNKDRTTYTFDRKKYPCFALFHPSGANRGSLTEHKDKQERAKKRIKAIIHGP
jgi:uracil-DNA glycosylase family 4